LKKRDVYADSPHRETLSFDDFHLPSLYLEDKIIIAVGDQHMVIDFEKDGFKLNNRIGYSTFHQGGQNLLGLKSAYYAIIPEQETAGSNYEISVSYQKGNNYEDVQSETFTTKDLTGAIPMLEKVRTINIELIQDSYITMPTITYEMLLKEPQLTVKLTSLE